MNQQVTFHLPGTSLVLTLSDAEVGRILDAINSDKGRSAGAYLRVSSGHDVHYINAAEIQYLRVRPAPEPVVPAPPDNRYR